MGVMASGVRRLTPIEVERLQGLPDGWSAPPGLDAPDSRRYAAVGDAVTANVSQWIGERLLRFG
jgi:DNA (cytosine-5)-methyltransferase 1